MSIFLGAFLGSFLGVLVCFAAVVGQLIKAYRKMVAQAILNSAIKKEKENKNGV